jgi:hypothetical protein
MGAGGPTRRPLGSGRPAAATAAAPGAATAAGPGSGAAMGGSSSSRRINASSVSSALLGLNRRGAALSSPDGDVDSPAAGAAAEGRGPRSPQRQGYRNAAQRK